MRLAVPAVFLLFPAGCLAVLFQFGRPDIDYWLQPLDVGPVASNFVYEDNAPYSDAVVTAWDLISEPKDAITGPWGNKTGLFVPEPYGNYGLGRSPVQPTTYVQIAGREVGMCLDVQASEIPDQTYNPNMKFYYKWNMDFYLGDGGEKTWLYPYHSASAHPNPQFRCTFEAAVKTSQGSGVRHANTAFQWLEEISGTHIFVQHYVYDSRDEIQAVSSGYDPKIGKLWIAQKLGDPDAYCLTLPGSAVFTNGVWSDYRMFGLDQPWSRFETMIDFLNARYGISMSKDRDRWRLVAASFNLEMQQGYEGCIAGKCRDMTLWTRH
ncbi:hypothetical protein [Tichowtungia aerotolerans]|uniref:Uncharacterized protein n=1 Tax=Tichowtungia aerotolerans TaxID=2697043 RepID=A0A6P1MDK6_9BACT|nr:hypothetical protein [Tichowtungia aerotolerans]QHI69185.1 hypothetical protein GT409_06875 [Tichowtungia aerotolerans]